MALIGILPPGVANLDSIGQRNYRTMSLRLDVLAYTLEQ